jgi:hypothetical protein
VEAAFEEYSDPLREVARAVRMRIQRDGYLHIHHNPLLPNAIERRHPDKLVALIRRKAKRAQPADSRRREETKWRRDDWPMSSG